MSETMPVVDLATRTIRRPEERATDEIVVRRSGHVIRRLFWNGFAFDETPHGDRPREEQRYVLDRKERVDVDFP